MKPGHGPDTLHSREGCENYDYLLIANSRRITNILIYYSMNPDIDRPSLDLLFSRRYTISDILRLLPDLDHFY
jgi:hypothetical protein